MGSIKDDQCFLLKQLDRWVPFSEVGKNIQGKF